MFTFVHWEPLQLNYICPVYLSFDHLDLNVHKTSCVLVWIPVLVCGSQVVLCRWSIMFRVSVIAEALETRCGLYVVVVVVNSEEKRSSGSIRTFTQSIHHAFLLRATFPDKPPDRERVRERERVTSKVGQVWETTKFMETHAVKSDGTYIWNHFYKNFQKSGTIKIFKWFWKKSLLLTKAAFIWSKIH